MNDRTVRAISVATAVVRGRGVAVDPVVLADSNHVLVRFGEIVAKVEPEPPVREGAASLARDVAVASWLAQRGAPVLEPADNPGPHRVANAALTLWRYCPHEAGAEPSREAAGLALRQMHAALAGYEGPLPRFTEQIDDAAQLLGGPAPLALSGEDRTFLLELHERERRGLDVLSRHEVLHGEFHAGQLLVTPRGLRWHDFECASRGPIEWDVAGLEDARTYGAVDDALLASLRALKQVCVVAWCAVAPDRHADLREALDYHLGDLRLRALQ